MLRNTLFTRVQMHRSRWRWTVWLLCYRSSWNC